MQVDVSVRGTYNDDPGGSPLVQLRWQVRQPCRAFLLSALRAHKEQVQSVAMATVIPMLDGSQGDVA